MEKKKKILHNRLKSGEYLTGHGRDKLSGPELVMRENVALKVFSLHFLSPRLSPASRRVTGDVWRVQIYAFQRGQLL